MAFVDSFFDGRQVDAPDAGVKLDAAGCYRLQDVLMLAMDEAGYTLREIAAFFSMNSSTVHRRLRQIPEAVRRHFAPVVADLVKWFPKPPGKGRKGPRTVPGRRKVRRMRVDAISSGRSATPEQRRLAAEAELDARCLEAVERYGRIPDAARALGIQARRVKAAVERSRRPEVGPEG
jgi:hypothetical protein